MFLKEKISLLGVVSVTNLAEPSSLVTLGFDDKLVTVPYRSVNIEEENMVQLKDEVLDELVDDGYSLVVQGVSSDRILESKKLLVDLLGEEGFEKAVAEKKDLYALISKGAPDSDYDKAIEKASNW